MNRGKFLKERQVKVNFFPIHIQLFMNASNSRNNNFRVSKIHKWVCGMCMIGEKFLKP